MGTGVQTFPVWTMLVRSSLPFIARTVKLLSGLSAAPYSMVVHYVDDYWNMKRFIFDLFIFSVMALGVLVRIDCVVAAATPLNATCLISTGGSASFPVSVFSVFPAISKAKTFGFWLFFSHFPTFCAVDLLLCVFYSSPPQFSP